MDKAKAAVHDFISHKAGHNDTTVHEKVAPAVTHETVIKKRHDEVQPVVDREVHKDHYHTTVQPVLDKAVLPEQHSHNVVPVEHREHRHGGDIDISRRLQEETAQFKDTRVKGHTEETTSMAPTVVGEHKHHHVHETIQPVVQKETIQPHVVHTTVPVHEVHHQAPEHHSASALPAISMADYKKHGGALSGREERYDAFDGEPRTVGGALNGDRHHNTTGTGAPQLPPVGSTGTGGGLLDNNTRHTDAHHSGTTGGLTHGTDHKPTLREKIDPRIDSDGDGKKGFMK